MLETVCIADNRTGAQLPWTREQESQSVEGQMTFSALSITLHSDHSSERIRNKKTCGTEHRASVSSPDDLYLENLLLGTRM